jgi:hypothetical protein
MYDAQEDTYIDCTKPNNLSMLAESEELKLPL